VHIEARYSFYTLTVKSITDDSGAAGAFTSMSNEKVIPGASVALTASVNEGYNFEGWYIGGTLISRSKDFSYVMTEKNTVIEARYSSYTVSTRSENNVAGVAGTYTQLNNKKVTVGSEVALTATVNEGYNFEGWYIDDVCVSKELAYTYVMERSNVSICAVYSAYTLTTWGGAKDTWDEYEQGFAAGTYTQYAQQNISAGQTVTLTATVNDGYNFVGWYVNDTLVSTDLEYSFTMGKEDITAQAIYNYYTLFTSAKYDDYGHMSFENSDIFINEIYNGDKISIGETITVTANDVTGWTFVGWRTYEAILSTQKTYTFNMTSSNLELYAYYEPKE